MILDKNPLKVEPDKIKDSKVLKAVKEGKLLHQKKQLEYKNTS